MTSAVSRISNAAPCSGPTKFCRSNLLNLVFRRSAVSIIHSCLSVCLECCCCTLLWLHKILQVQLAQPCFVLQSATVSLFTLSVSMSEYCSLLWLHKIMQVQLCSVSRSSAVSFIHSVCHYVVPNAALFSGPTKSYRSNWLNFVLFFEAQLFLFIHCVCHYVVPSAAPFPGLTKSCRSNWLNLIC